MVKAYHFLEDNYCSEWDDESPWTVGEERYWRGAVKLGQRGYHSSPSWYDGLQRARGNIACIVEVSEPVEHDAHRQVSKTCKLIAAANVARELRLWACDRAWNVLLRESQETPNPYRDREYGPRPDGRSWAAIRVARRYANGEATRLELAAAFRDTYIACGHDPAAKVAMYAATYTTLGQAEAYQSVRIAAGGVPYFLLGTTARIGTDDAAYVAARGAAAAAIECIGEATYYRTPNAHYDGNYPFHNPSGISAASDARKAETEWQRQHLAKMLDARLVAVYV